MFDYFAMLLSSITSFLFPVFASYKALKTSDPAQLTPWLMYWVVFSCCLLVESWLGFILTWIPLYGYVRLAFFLYLILPQTQGARVIYESHVHPFLEENETQIDTFIANTHANLKAAGLAYLKQAIEYIKVNLLGLPPSEPSPRSSAADSAPQSYTQSLLARFSVPTARWAGSTGAATVSAGNDLYGLLTAAVSSVTSSGEHKDEAPSPGGSLIPAGLQDATEKMTFISAQRERLNILLSALDREAQGLQSPTDARSGERASRSAALDSQSDEEPTQRPPSGLSVWSALSKSRSEVDFEKIEAGSGAEDNEEASLLRRRGNADDGEQGTPTPSNGGGSWMPWGRGASSGVDG